ncbi:4'-phosphopantetheinyl transferase [Pholiota conissans]|uniref:4'-phosphopantetheinyl transferase n=1 Tax=Pholiota conissans TaxID=109636 RepID=A0A9P5ZAJ2_9AGAR|nr:4'-phosphopantetheinyl transferase [Pholiota conissans]
MPILGIGVDLVHIPRIAALLSRRTPQKFAAKILSPEEYSQWESIPPSESRRAQFLAVRWSVKEAAYKAMYPIIRPTWKEITYTSFSSTGEKPFVKYHPTVPDVCSKIGRMHVSVSHDGDYVYSTVLVEEPQNRG